MGYNIVVLIKQVPDTKRITGQAMNDDGTVNRSALPAIFNPEDLNALELAIEIKDEFSGSITAITMGPPSAAEVLRDCLYRGADDAVLITDMRCAASDTLATSYILSCAVKKFDYDLVLCGRQAIDGDTAQVGPQLAEKLGIPQITYVEEFTELNGRTITARRNIGAGWQQVKTALPVLLTVTGEANMPPGWVSTTYLMPYSFPRGSSFSKPWRVSLHRSMNESFWWIDSSRLYASQGGATLSILPPTEARISLYWRIRSVFHRCPALM